MQSLNGGKIETTAERRHQRWHAPESQPLQLTVKSPLHAAGDPRAAAGFGVVVLLAVGVLGAFVVNKTAGSGTEAEPMVATSPAEPTEIVAAVSPPKPVIIQGTPAVEPANTPSPAVFQSGATDTTTSEPAAKNPLNANRIERATDSMLLALDAEPAQATSDNKDTVVTAAVISPNVPVPLPTAAPRKELPASDATEPSAKVVEEPAIAEAEDTRPGRIKTAVNMRASGTDKAKVIGVVPANASVDVVGCKSWCEIVYKKQRGWIYKGFLRTN
ncbi:SH3 domain-containing protein [Mesorhizobium sp. NBSH29]|uniref:SH3 domain-containing protein n=1 Tax=Mesorhizobium sp. NBSH29 TaxID=2654249 RepID=UPI001896A45E|nr:SH3 domain-containing protein [Mesorhizobium sp. NBSH29]